MSITLVHLELDEAVVYQALKCNLSFNEYKMLAEWLECYNYVLPADRGLVSEFILVMDNEQHCTTTAIYKLWMKANIIDSTLAPHKQRKILSWIMNP